MGRSVSISQVPSIKPVLLFCCQLMSRRNVGPSFTGYYSVVMTYYDIRLITLETSSATCPWYDMKTMVSVG